MGLKSRAAALCLACLLLCQSAFAERVNLRIAFDNAAFEGVTVGLRIEPYRPAWIEPTNLILGEVITRSSIRSPVVITNIFGSDSTNYANYKITFTGGLKTEYWVHVPSTNCNAEDIRIAAPSSSGGGNLGFFLSGVIKTNGTAIGTAASAVDWTTGVTGYMAGAVARLGVSASSGGSSSGSTFSVATNAALVATNPVAVRFTNSGNVAFSGASNAAGASISANVDLSVTNALALVNGGTLNNATLNSITINNDVSGTPNFTTGFNSEGAATFESTLTISGSGNIATNIASRAPHAATTPGSNAIPAINGTGSNTTVIALTNATHYFDSSRSNYVTLSNGLWRVVLGGVERLNINTNTGTIGIGTTAASDALTIGTGNIKLLGGGFLGTAGSVLDAIYPRQDNVAQVIGDSGTRFLQAWFGMQVVATNTGNFATMSTNGFKTTGGTYYQSNGLTAALVLSGITNGGGWVGPISNSIQSVFMTNNIAYWKSLNP